MENCSRCGLPLIEGQTKIEYIHGVTHGVFECIELLKAELDRVNEARRILSDPVVDPRNSDEPYKEPLP